MIPIPNPLISNVEQLITNDEVTCSAWRALNREGARVAKAISWAAPAKVAGAAASPVPTVLIALALRLMWAKRERDETEGPMDVLAEKLDSKLREWRPETAAQVRQRVAEIIPNILDEPATR